MSRPQRLFKAVKRRCVALEGWLRLSHMCAKVVMVCECSLIRRDTHTTPGAERHGRSPPFR